jgi:hypothetical protein
MMILHDDSTRIGVVTGEEIVDLAAATKFAHIVRRTSRFD